jgi:hypothetical protein
LTKAEHLSFRPVVLLLRSGSTGSFKTFSAVDTARDGVDDVADHGRSSVFQMRTRTQSMGMEFSKF